MIGTNPYGTSDLTGPEGPEGPAGPQGPQGDPGSDAGDRQRVYWAGQGLISQNYDRQLITVGVAPTSGNIHFVAMPLLAGDVITNLHFGMFNSAGSLPTLAKAGLYRPSDGARLALSADLGAAVQTAGLKTAAMIAPYVVPADGIYYGALIIVAATVGSVCRLAPQAVGSTCVALPGGIAPVDVMLAQADLVDPAVFAGPTSQSIAIWMGAS